MSTPLFTREPQNFTAIVGGESVKTELVPPVQEATIIERISFAIAGTASLSGGLITIWLISEDDNTYPVPIAIHYEVTAAGTASAPESGIIELGLTLGIGWGLWVSAHMEASIGVPTSTYVAVTSGGIVR